MPLTLLKIIQQAQGELGLPVSSTVVNNTDGTTVQMFALANRCIDELRRASPTGWTALQFEYDLVVPPAIHTTGDLLTSFTNVISNIPSTAALSAHNFYVSGTSLPQGARVSQVIDANTVQLTMEAVNTAPVTGAGLTFAQDLFPEPPDFDWFQNRSMWDRTNHWELIGPSSPQIDQWYQSGIVTLGPRRHFRQVGPYANCFRIWPPPSELVAPIQLVFEYISLNSVILHGGAVSPPAQPSYSQTWVNDDDINLMDDQAIIMGIKWMFWEAKGMGSYVTMQNRWVDYVERMIARDGAAPTLQLAKRVSPIFISPANVQDGFFPGPNGSS